MNSAVYPLNSMLPDYFKENLGFDKERASTLSSVFSSFSIICLPLMGKLIDMSKCHPVWVIVGSGLLGVSELEWRNTKMIFRIYLNVSEIFQPFPRLIRFCS